MEAKSVARQREIRDRFMEEVYDQSGGDPMCWPDVDEVAQHLGLEYDEWRPVHTYLLRAGLLDSRGPRLVSMTTYGVDYVENMVLKRQEQRFKLLREIYEALEGSQSKVLPGKGFYECADAVRLARSEAEDAREWLYKQDLLRGFDGEGGVQLTQSGVQEVERSLAHPNEATEHFPMSVVQNVTHNYQISGPVGALQSGSHNTATVVQNVAVGDSAMTALAQLRHAAEKLSGEDREEAIELVDTIEEQVRSRKPKKSVIKQCGEGLAGKIKEIDVVALVSLLLNAAQAASAAGM